MVRVEIVLAALVATGACCLVFVVSQRAEARETNHYLRELGAISRMDGQCRTSGSRACCKRAGWALKGMRKLIEDIIQCKVAVFSNMLDGRMKFPPVCCKLPMFRRACKLLGIVDGEGEGEGEGKVDKGEGGLLEHFGESEDNTSVMATTGCCKRTDLERFNLIEMVYDCVKALVNNILEGNIQFPKACCKLPVFNLFCQNKREMLEYRSMMMGDY